MSTTTLPTPVTVAITRRVSGGTDTQMLAWVRAGVALAEGFPGFLGTGWVRPGTGSDEWHMLYRFASHADLATWEASPERAWWLSSAQGLVEHDREERRVGIEGWFDEPEHVTVAGPADRRAVPPRWKQATMIWLAFFPLSVLASYLLAPVSGHWPVPARVLLSTVLMTPLMTYVVLPFMGKLLDPWLHAR